MMPPTVAPTIAAADLQVGAAVPEQEQTFTVVDLVAYGAATWDWHRLHYDIEYARSMKLPNVIIDGQSYGAVFSKAALDWLGPRALVRKMSLRYKSMAFAGDTLRTVGTVSAVAPADDDADLITVAQKLLCGERVVAEATTVVRLPR